MSGLAIVTRPNMTDVQRVPSTPPQHPVALDTPRYGVNHCGRGDVDLDARPPGDTRRRPCPLTDLAHDGLLVRPHRGRW